MDEGEFEIIIVLYITVHALIQGVTLSHDKISGAFNKWDNTRSGATCGGTNPEAHSAFVLVVVTTRDNMDRLQTE